MARTERFSTGFLKLDDRSEEVFLSVTPGFEHGPGIQRDGITAPRMSDPHSVARVRNHFKLPAGPTLPATTDPYVQRAGTWTVYHHLNAFLEAYGDEWQVVGIQSNGDLTMNPWHVAYIGESHIPHQSGELCALRTDNDPQEQVASRVYRCLVKWKQRIGAKIGARYECLNIRFEKARGGYALKIHDTQVSDRCYAAFHGCAEYDADTRDIAKLVEFVLAGKLVVEDGVELPLANAIDRFEDVRHVFNLPPVRAEGFFRNQHVARLNFGEYELFANVNTRRAALSSPVVIDLDIDGRVRVSWNEVRAVLLERHFRETVESPSRRGQFRRYGRQEDTSQVEVFLPHNVYPFGVLGVQAAQRDGGSIGPLVCLSSGGLSGRVGMTLEGVARIMFDFFGCGDAMVLDEGYDVFFIANPKDETGRYRFSNEELLGKVLAFTKMRVDRDHSESLRTAVGYCYPGGLKGWPLNQRLVDQVDRAFAASGQQDYADILLVEPWRSQMRSVLIFARNLAQDSA